MRAHRIAINTHEPLFKAQTQVKPRNLIVQPISRLRMDIAYIVNKLDNKKHFQG